MIWGWYKKSPNGNLINIKSNVFKETFLRAPSSEIEYFKYKIEFFTIQDGIRTVNGSNLIIKNFQSSDFSTYLCMDLSYRFVESQFIKLSKTLIAYRERCLHLKGSILFLFKASPTCPISRCVCNYTNELNCANKNLRNLDEILYASKESLLNISIFDLASNQLSFLSRDVFSSLSNLIQLKFSFNKIESVDANAFTKLTKLNRLLLNNNQLTILKESTFNNNNENLQYIDLSYNKLEFVDRTLFNGLASLLNLKLNNNLISSIVDNSFETLILLQSLDLSHNRLTTIREKTFSGLKQVESINLEYNHIYEFDINSLSSLDKLNEINLNNNLFKQSTYSLDCATSNLSLNSSKVSHAIKLKNH